MDFTEDRILDGAVRLRQARGGYRVGMDAALLAAACDARDGERVLEPGCGVGGVLLAAAARRPQAHFVGIERDPAALDLALHNLRDNGLEGRAEVRAGDIAGPFADLGLEPFDAAMANPPYFDDPSRLRGPSQAKRGAWIADQGLTGWTRFLLSAVRPGGAITLIHRADALEALLPLLAPAAGSIQVRPVHPFTDAPAVRILVRAIKGGRAPLQILPALVLHERGEAKHAPAAEAIFRGQAALDWR